MTLASRKPPVVGERGASLVEFALVALLSTLLMLGVVEVCRVVLVYNDISNAAAEGVRYAAVHGRTQTNASQVTNVVRNYLASAPMASGNATVNTCYATNTTTCTSGDCGSRPTGLSTAPIGSYVTVCVAYTYDPFVTYFPLRPTLGTQSQGVILY